MNMTMTPKLHRQLRRLNFVPRWAIFPSNRTQSVAEHCFNVATITLWLLDQHDQSHNIQFRLKCLEAAIIHDADESLTGDTPSPNKELPSPEAIAAYPQAKIVLKVADLLEAFAWLYEEQLMGNGINSQPVSEDALKRCLLYWENFQHKDKSRPHFDEMIASFLKTIHDPETIHPIFESGYEL